MTTYIQKAIEKSIEGGYKTNPITTAEKEQGFQHNVSEIFLDSLFWRGLGKSCGWDDGEHKDESFGWSGNPSLWMWQHKWHRFIDHLISSKPTEEFFKDLLE